MDQEVQFEAGSQQTTLSGFFRNVRSKFSGLLPTKVDDVVITSHILRKKPQLVIGNASNHIPPPELARSNVGDPVTKTKRKATTEVEGVKKKRVMREPKIIKYNEFSAVNPAIEKEEMEGMVNAVTWEQDSDWMAMNEPVFNTHEESNKVECVSEVQEVQHFGQSSPSLLQDSPTCQLKETARVGTKLVDKEGSSESLDVETCTISENCHRKDEQLGGKWSLPVDLKGDVFSCKLKEVLAKPFDEKESEEIWDLATRRKPVLKLRQTRGRTMQVTTDDEGLSYLDHHPDLARRLDECSHPSEKLVLLRSFFFWLTHSCMEGAYKPWVPAPVNTTEEDDCNFTDGLDCEVLAVVLPLDEKKEVCSVMKPVEPITVELSDDDEDNCLEISESLPVKAVPKPSNCKNFRKASTCNRCCKEFGLEKGRQRALYKSCGHIETCVNCVGTLWMRGQHSCKKCGAIESVWPRSVMDFAEDSD